MDAVVLHHALDAVDTLEDEGEKGIVVVGGDGFVHGFEVADVVGAVVAGERDTEDDDLGAAGGEAGGELDEVVAGTAQGNAAEAVVAAELEEDDFRRIAKGVVHAIDAALGGVAADACVDDAVAEAFFVEEFLEDVGIGLACFEAEAGGDAVAEAENDGAIVSDGLDQVGLGDFDLLFFFGILLGAAREKKCDQKERKKRKQSHHCQNKESIPLMSNSMAVSVENVTREIATGTHLVKILKGISFEIPHGEFVAIMGSSGSGKSTLLGLLAGLDAPTSGRIALDGVDITHLKEDDMARVRGEKVGFVFQSYQLIPTLTAEENVMLPHELSGRPGNGTERARQLLEEVGLADRMHHYPIQLSGGEQQRVALARAFMTQPPILLADEPTGNLDTANGRIVLDLLIRLNREQKTTLVMVTHDKELATYADRVLTLRDGLLVSDERKAQ